MTAPTPGPDKRTVSCRGCGAPIIFLPTRKGKMNPCDAETVEPGDLLFDIGKHRSHFFTCPKASQFKNGYKETPAPKAAEPETLPLFGDNK